MLVLALEVEESSSACVIDSPTGVSEEMLQWQADAAE